MKVVMFAYSNMEYTIELTEAIAKKEDMLLIIPDYQAARFREVIHPAVKLFVFSYKRIRELGNILMIVKIMRAIYRFRPDVVHIQNGHPWLNFALPFLKMYKMFLTVHDVELRDWPSKKIPHFIQKMPLFFANRIIVHGQKLKEDMMRINRKKSWQVLVTRRGVNSIYTRFQKEEFREEPYTILYYGRIWEYKGLQYLIEAEPLIAGEIPDVKIIIAGTGENFSKYRSMMKNPDRFEVINEYVSAEKTIELFQRAAVVILPYTAASQSGVIPQAYAFGKPVIVSDVGSLTENVRDGKTGIIVPPRDITAIKDAAVKILKDTALRQAMQKEAEKFIEEELSWDKIADETIRHYKKTLGKYN